jgi:hypothetical protein
MVTFPVPSTVRSIGTIPATFEHRAIYYKQASKSCTPLGMRLGARRVEVDDTDSGDGAGADRDDDSADAKFYHPSAYATAITIAGLPLILSDVLIYGFMFYW